MRNDLDRWKFCIAQANSWAASAAKADRAGNRLLAIANRIVVNDWLKIARGYAQKV
jgi:hypothetical protein